MAKISKIEIQEWAQSQIEKSLAQNWAPEYVLQHPPKFFENFSNEPGITLGKNGAIKIEFQKIQSEDVLDMASKVAEKYYLSEIAYLRDEWMEGRADKQKAEHEFECWMCKNDLY